MNGNEKKTGFFKNLLLLGRLGNGSGEEAVFLWLAIAVWSYFIVGGAIMLALFAVVLLNKKFRKTVFSDRKAFTPGAILSAFSLAVSLLYGNYIGAGISVGIFAILVFGCFANANSASETYEKVSVLCCLGSIVACICAFVQNFIIFGYNPDYRPTAGAFNANYYGALIAFTYILCLVRIFDGKQTEKDHPWYRPTKWFYIITAVLNLFALLISESRSALLAVMVCTGVFLLLKKQYVIFGVAAALGAGLWIFCWFYPDALSWTNSLSFIITERTTIWKDALRSYVSSPLSVLFGRGPMTYYMVWEREGLYEANHVHNILFDTLLNSGIIGLSLYLCLAAGLVKKAISYFKNKNTAAFEISVLLLFEIFVQGCADVTIMWHQSAALFLLLFFTTEKKRKFKR